MKVFLAGEHSVKNGALAMDYNHALYILESYYYARTNKWVAELLPRFKGFLLDSGAFTFMTNVNKTLDWETYVENYAEYINRHNITNFFELDIDSVVGLKETERLRQLLEKRTGHQSIPVWHKSRGKDYWIGMAKDYPYIAIGGLVNKEISRNEHRYFPWFLDVAHAHGARVHGLGYTNLEGLKKYNFDSVDSTAWVYGNRSGLVFEFDGTKVVKNKAPKGKKLHARDVAIQNFKAWA